MLLSKTLFLAAIFSVATYQVSAKGNVCSNEDTSHLSLPEVLGIYLGNPTLLNAYLTRLRSHPYVDTFFKYLREDVVSSNQQASLFALQSALLLSTFLGNKINNTCSLSIAIDLAVDYENTGDKDVQYCGLTYIEYAGKIGINDIMEFFLQEVGCGAYFDKAELSRPTCTSKKCLSGGQLSNWDAAYKIVNNNLKKNGLPPNPSVYSSLKQLLGTRDKNLWGVALTWLTVGVHGMWGFEAGINTEPIAFELAAHVLQFLEFIAFSKECSCEDRAELGHKIVDNLTNSITKEMVFLKSK